MKLSKALLALALLTCLTAGDRGGAYNLLSARAAAPGDANPEMVPIPEGKFIMGDKSQSDAKPHPVSVSPFLMDKYLVSQEVYQRVMNSNPSRWKKEKNPVEQVRWSDAVRFCNRR